jgi:hypothetical protein
VTAQAKRHLRKITVNYAASKKIEIAAGLFVLAENRTRHLHRHAHDTAISELLVNAYLQGLTDAIDTLDKHNLLK